ncbi:hypothetical protein SAMN00808754_2080 [Thermanaeromonas toyohensis ToBE]|uniref:DUF3467 domain-containing protein n=1 Tax=Thermanaeromonas toyohensis ToBE TaxID=698762 RepID=A0A1W1VXF7_9FIRM|nr:hypothetical protein [Thermanaeromonas toyohensis]SMB98018.1 hypothetical protein SAMN00808754_2080 [Thermanaeromonas toyohensis ToBE]
MENPANTPKSSPQLESRLIATEPSALQIQFADLVQANVNPERVVLTFIQNLPGNAPPEAINTGNVIDGRVIAQIAVSWPHLVRIRDLLTRIIEHYRQEVIRSVNSALGEAEESE